MGEETLLNQSQQMFDGWSYGFGEVEVTNIEIYVGSGNISDSIVEPMFPSNTIMKTSEPSVQPTASPKGGIEAIIDAIGVHVLFMIAVGILAILLFCIFICCMCRVLKQNRNQYSVAPRDESDTEASDGYLNEVRINY